MECYYNDRDLLHTSYFGEMLVTLTISLKQAFRSDEDYDDPGGHEELEGVQESKFESVHLLDLTAQRVPLLRVDCDAVVHGKGYDAHKELYHHK